MGATGCAKAADTQAMQSVRAVAQIAPGYLVLWVLLCPSRSDTKSLERRR